MLVLATAEGVAAITAGATLLGAIGLAGVTVYTTNRRLSEERKRQERALAAERERQVAALAHDRRLADIADLRQLLDEAAAALERASVAHNEAAINVALLHDNATTELRRQLSDESCAKLNAVAPALEGLGGRLQVRLGPADPIAHAFSAAVTSFEQMRDMAQLLRYSTSDEYRTSEAQEAVEAFTRQASGFLSAAVERAGTVV